MATQTTLELEVKKRDMNRDIRRLFNQHSVTVQLNAIDELNESLGKDYQKAVREFKAQEYPDAVRDIGRAAETLIELLCDDLDAEDDIPDDMSSRLNRLDKTEEGLSSFIGKTLAPAWWLRNKANHPTEYEVTKADAHYSLLCFQMAVEKYVEEYLDADVVY